jgi:hypothetical protein
VGVAQLAKMEMVKAGEILLTLILGGVVLQGEEHQLKHKDFLEIQVWNTPQMLENMLENKQDLVEAEQV